MNYYIHARNLVQCNGLYTHDYYILSNGQANDCTLNHLIPRFLLPYKFNYNGEFLRVLVNTTVEHLAAMDNTFNNLKNIDSMLLYYRNPDSYFRSLFRLLSEVQRITSACYKYIKEDFLSAIVEFIQSGTSCSKTLLTKMNTARRLLIKFMRYVVQLSDFLNSTVHKHELDNLNNSVNYLIGETNNLSSNLEHFQLNIGSAYKELTNPSKLLFLN